MIVLIDAVDTATVIGNAIVAWIVAAALVATIVLLTGAALGTWACRTLWRAARRPLPARQRSGARIPHRSRHGRHSEPTETHDYQEAA